MARSRGRSIIAASHTTELAEKWGRKVRNLISEHGATLAANLSQDSQAAGRWSLATGGEYYAAGVGTGIAGFRADGAIIDDPIRSREDADSETVREKTWEWYKSDLLTRLRPGGFVVLIQTRWHEDDLAGRAIEEMTKGGDKWAVLSLPAEAEEDDALGREPGEWLWDDQYGYAKFLAREKATQIPRNWSALYQQRPTPETGDYFKEIWLKPYHKAPARETLSVYMASDYAVTSNGGDYTVHVVVGIDPEGHLWLLDLWRKQSSSKAWVEAWCDLVCEWKPYLAAEEQGQIRSGVGPFLDQRAIERQAWCGREQFPTRGDKAVRAQAIRGRMELIGLHVPVKAPWYPALRAELLSFPAGKHDDQVDALGLLGQLLDKVMKGRKIKPPTVVEETGYKPYENELANDSFLAF